MLLGSADLSTYGSLVVYDHTPSVDGRDFWLFTDDKAWFPTGGTVARAGVGWLSARCSPADDPCQTVRLEALDAPPEDDLGDWDEVLETPYWSLSGALLLIMVKGNGDAAFEIGPPGQYRVRVSCIRDFRADTKERSVDAILEEHDRYVERGDLWRLQFWPSPASAEPPRWLTRPERITAPADEDSTGASGGSADDEKARLGYLAGDLLALTLWTPGGAAGTVADIAARLLASPGAVRAAIRQSVSAGQLGVAGDPGDDTAPLTFTLLLPSPGDEGDDDEETG
jgi:hypothetical protein